MGITTKNEQNVLMTIGYLSMKMCLIIYCKKNKIIIIQ